MVMKALVDVVPSPNHETIRAWSQFRLQRRISVRGLDIKAMCPLCRSANGATLAHLLSTGKATTSFSEQLMVDKQSKQVCLSVPHQLEK